MKISKHDQKLILVLLGLAVFLAAYLGICRNFNDRKADVKAQITQLQAEADTLSAYSANQASYQDEINKIETSLSSELADYPSDVRSEDMIMYVTELEKNIDISVGGISIASPEVVAKFTIPKTVDGSYQLVPVAAVKTGLTINCSMNYTQLKKLIEYVNTKSGKADVSDVTVSYDSQSGDLSGSVTIDKYFISTADYTYTPTKIPSVEKGTKDPFGTFSTPATTSPSPSPSPSGTH